jgi:hypothetical protein
LFDEWYEKKSLNDIPSNIALLKDRLFLSDHVDYRPERGGAISFHIKVLSLSMIGLILSANKEMVCRQLLQDIISSVACNTKSYDYSDRVCFSITVRIFINVIKEEFAHFGSMVSDLSFGDFANEETLNPKPPPVISVL